MPPLRWKDADEIGGQLFQIRLDVDPLTVRFTELALVGACSPLFLNRLRSTVASFSSQAKPFTLLLAASRGSRL